VTVTVPATVAISGALSVPATVAISGAVAVAVTVAAGLRWLRVTGAAHL
jgi:hypothetical protein